MAALEKIMQMKQRGMSESQIIQSLREQGVNPKEINEALSQSKIKSELTGNPQAVIPISEQMQPSIMPTQEQYMQPPSPTTDVYTSETMPSSYQSSTAPYPETESYPDYSEQQEPYYQEYQEYYPEYQPPQPIDLETINDIAEQIVEEKNVQLKKQISSFAKFKENTVLEIEKINQRLEKIEKTFNELQIAILRKIGDYGEDIQNISKEMHATQDSFSKILDPLTDNIRELRKITDTKSAETPQTKISKKPSQTKKQESTFEDYLR